MSKLPERARIGMRLAEGIERENKARSRPTYRGRVEVIFNRVPKSKMTRYSPGFCSICQDYYNVITKDHARMHGFDSPDEMAKSDICRPICGRFEKEKKNES